MTLDDRMLETLPAPTVVLPPRSELTAKARAVIEREDRAIKLLAMEFARRAFSQVKGLPDELAAMHLQAEAMRQAADIIDKEMRTIEAGKR